MTICEFVNIGEDTYQCMNCGLKVKIVDNISEPPAFPCKKSLSRHNTKEPDFVQKIKNFAGSFTDHIKNGLPMCDQQQIIKRHNICLGCEFFKEDTCTKCGCPISRNKNYISKLAWADQECPVGKWKKEI